MVPFVCTRCGKCCMNFGRYITIERTITPSDFICRFTLRNERFSAKILPECISLFSSRPRNPASASWCTFLRESPDGKGFICTIFPHRPSHCRNYRCYTAKVLDPDGEFIGKVGNGKNLISRDPALNAIWEREIRSVSTADEQGWRDAVRQILATHGYRFECIDENEPQAG